jgi:sialate O-acetylesterase
MQRDVVLARGAGGRLHVGMRKLSLLVLSLLLAPALRAELKLPALFSDGAVLQRGQPIPVWGWSQPGAELHVLLGEELHKTRADAFGRWAVEFAPRKVGAPLRLVVETQGGRLQRNGLLVGEVWICSGQSNMEWALERAMNAKQEIAGAQDEGLRLFRVQRRASLTPTTDVEARWTACTAETAAKFSGVGYFFGRHLREQLEVPVGLIQSAWGGTSAQTWTSHEGLMLEQGCWPEYERWQARIAGDKSGKIAKDKNRPGNLYRGMLHPLVPYAMRGVIWYQGENNASRAFEYRSVFPNLIRDWRRVWALGPHQMHPREPRAFPFLFVQLANYTVRRNPLSWAELREAQELALELPATGMAVTIDIGNPKDIHPRNKQEVGRRLALIARKQVYGESSLLASGPRFARARFAGQTVTVECRDVADALRTRDGQAPSSFEVAGADRKFYPAQARIDGQFVLVSSPRVPAPVAVRYGWSDAPHCNVTDSTGLPLAPFRSDDWPGVTWPLAGR